MTKSMRRNFLMLNGVCSQSAVFSITPINYDATLFYDMHRKFVQVGVDCSLSMEFMLGGDSDYVDRVLKSIEPGEKKNFVFLGDGYVCRYCGDYNPAGLVSCINCGGQTILEPASVRNFPFFVNQYTIGSGFLGYTELSVEFVFTGNKPNSDVFWLRTDIYTLPYSYTLRENLYVCQYCGRTVESGRKCPGCGGARAPLSEVVKMENTCLYCGNKVVGGVICKSCGSTLKSVAYHEIGGLND